MAVALFNLFVFYVTGRRVEKEGSLTFYCYLERENPLKYEKLYLEIGDLKMCNILKELFALFLLYFFVLSFTM